MPPRLYVNIDHVATLRQQRGTRYPDPVLAAGLCELAGAEGITVHLREDRRHIQDRDVRLLRQTVRGVFNLEMAATDEMLAIAVEVGPDFCTLVPEKRAERTTEGGLSVPGDAAGALGRVVAGLRAAGIAVSLFIDPDPEVVARSHQMGATTVELHTGYYCDAPPRSAEAARQLTRLEVASRAAGKLGLRLGAGHGLDYANVAPVAALPHLEELNIGHGLVARAVMVGLERAVTELRQAIAVASSAGLPGACGGAIVILGIGLDIVPIARVASMLARHGWRAQQRLFSAEERADCEGRGDPAQHYAVRFAAKEAALKALGVPPGLKWTEIEVRSADTGRPFLLLSGAAAAAAAQQGVKGQHLSLTHAGGMAAAVVVLEGGGVMAGPLPPPLPSTLVLSCAQMQAIDRDTIRRTGLPSAILMENAGRGIAQAIWRRIDAAPVEPPPVVAIVCGAGNNGGDGLVVARHLVLLAQGALQARVLLVAPAEQLQGDPAMMLRALRDLPGVTVSDLSGARDGRPWEEALMPADVIVDAIFGTGLRSDVSGAAALAITAMNGVAGMRVAVDIPSGLDGDTGRPRGLAVRADATVTVAARKLGLVVDPEAPVGQLEVVGFGVPLAPDPALGPFCYWTDETTVRTSLPAPRGTAHKGSRGHLIVVAGSLGKTGAALLTSHAALRAGAGLVTVASTSQGQVALDAKVIEAMTASFTDGDDATPDSFERLAALWTLPTVRAMVVGPGIPRGSGMRGLVHRLAREVPVPLVLDADALNLLGGGEAAAILAQARGPRLLTPHPGEMARLCGRSTAEVQADRLNVARRFAADSRAIVVLKGARTLIVAPDGMAFINPAVEPALATAGSGDVLTGVLGGLLSQGMDPLSAARAAVFLHGTAGARASGSYGAAGVVAGDLPEAIAAVRAAWAAEAAESR